MIPLRAKAPRGLYFEATALSVALSTCARLAAAQSTTATHEHPQVQLSYSRAPGTERCPDEAAVRRGVQSRLGYNPFRDDAPRAVLATLTQRGPRLQASVVLQHADGTRSSPRTIATRARDCHELASAMTLAISIAIDPLSATRPTRTSGRAVPVDRTPAAEQLSLRAVAEHSLGSVLNPTLFDTTDTELTAPQTPRPTVSLPRQPDPQLPARLQFFAGLGTGLSLGLSPMIAGFGNLSFGLRWGIFSMAIEARIDAAPSIAALGGTVSTTPNLFTAIPCGHFRWLAFCGVAGAGVLRGGGRGFATDRNETAPLILLGGRVAAELPPVWRLRFRVHADVGVVPITGVVLVDDQEVFRTFPITGSLGIDVHVNFP